ncbi:MAG TPA: hypothetical protein VLA44_10740 [Clostridia bacterium]|nr:hypothetical protein [Clostridia bacterium]
MSQVPRSRIQTLVALLSALVLAFATAGGASAQTPSADGDDRVTGQAYVRHDGGTDAGIEHCNDDGTDEAGDDNPDDGDVDSNDGGSRRQANEPFTVIDPTNPDLVVAGWNDYCLTDLGAGWQGFAYSLDAGESWTNSIVPGYPMDTSAEGMASPLFGRHTDAGDPIAAFDNDGNLFVGGISFNRVKPSNGDVYVATYGTNPHPSGYPLDYQRTVVVGKGTPSEVIGGIFQDKPMLEVDRTGGPHDGNVYVCWSRFTGAGQNKAYFSRSTDGGATFSRPISISRSNEVLSIQGCDIAIEADGDVFVTFRTFTTNKNFQNGLAYARSTDGGASFSTARLIRNIVPYAPANPARDCGDGPFLCTDEFVFHRVPLEPRVTADQTGALPGVHLTYNAVRPDSIVPSETSYSSAGGGRVGQSLVYVVSSWDNGATWSDPVAVDPAATGHQFFPDIDALAGTMAVVWQDNRTDDDYSVQLPIGNALDAEDRPVSSGTDVVNTFLSYSTDGETWTPLGDPVSSESHQSAYEMFGSRDIPFHGDYNWISLAERGDGSLFGYMSWTDNRDVLEGDDPRETTAPGGYDDNFDVLQCRIDLGAADGDDVLAGVPLARADAPFTGDNCGNAGGLDQNIYGTSITFP